MVLGMKFIVLDTVKKESIFFDHFSTLEDYCWDHVVHKKFEVGQLLLVIGETHIMHLKPYCQDLKYYIKKLYGIVV